MTSATVREIPLICSPVKLMKSIFFKWLKASGNSLKVKQTLKNIYKTSVGKAKVSCIWTKMSLFLPALSQLWGSETPRQTLAAKNAWLPLTKALKEVSSLQEEYVSVSHCAEAESQISTVRSRGSLLLISLTCGTEALPWLCYAENSGVVIILDAAHELVVLQQEKQAERTWGHCTLTHQTLIS